MVLMMMIDHFESGSDGWRLVVLPMGWPGKHHQIATCLVGFDLLHERTLS